MGLLAAAPAPPRRAVSLSLCSDELALALAAPGQLVSVTWLGADPRETALAGRAGGLRLNNGRIESVASLRPDLVLTSGAAGAYGAELAARLGARVLDLPPPETPDGVRANIARLGAALGRSAAAQALIARYNADLGAAPARLRPALMLQNGGFSPAPTGLSAAYLAAAGLRQLPTAGGRADAEHLIIAPPQVIVTTRYHPGETSLGQLWLRQPWVRRLRARRIDIDGRGWTCLGPEAARTLPGLRAALSR